MKITCFGSGIFSIAIAHLLAEKSNNHITIWSHDKTWVEKSNKKKELIIDTKRSIELKNNISLTTDYEEAIKDTDVIFILVSSNYYMDILNELKYHHLKKTPIYIGTKGLIDAKPYYLTNYTKKVLKSKKISYFAGPNFAEDLLLDAPCVMTIASKKKKYMTSFQNIMPSFIQTEFIKDYNVLELASILKNIYAIGAGIIYEKYPYSSTLLSYSALAAKELAKILYNKFDFEDLELYSGLLGDFYLTTTSMNSRNFTFGKKRSKSATTATEYRKKYTVEGYNNLEIIYNYLQDAKKYPIIENIYKIIYKNEKADTLINICFKKN